MKDNKISILGKVIRFQHSFPLQLVQNGVSMLSPSGTMGWRAFVNSAVRWKGPTPATCGCNRWVVATWAEPVRVIGFTIFKHVLSFEPGGVVTFKRAACGDLVTKHGVPVKFADAWCLISLTQAWSILYSTNSVQSKLTNGSPICFLCFLKSYESTGTIINHISISNH